MDTVNLYAAFSKKQLKLSEIDCKLMRAESSIDVNRQRGNNSRVDEIDSLIKRLCVKRDAILLDLSIIEAQLVKLEKFK